jgi:hypothetical protein
MLSSIHIFNQNVKGNTKRALRYNAVDIYQQFGALNMEAADFFEMLLPNYTASYPRILQPSNNKQ